MAHNLKKLLVGLVTVSVLNVASWSTAFAGDVADSKTPVDVLTREDFSRRVVLMNSRNFLVMNTTADGQTHPVNCNISKETKMAPFDAGQTDSEDLSNGCFRLATENCEKRGAKYVGRGNYILDEKVQGSLSGEVTNVYPEYFICGFNLH